MRLTNLIIENKLYLELILGGMRSGKSRMAQERCHATKKDVVYIATATAGDDEMRQRIARHRQDRPSNWHTVEQSIYLAEAMKAYSRADNCVLVDCLTLWITNLLCADDPALLDAEIDSFFSTLKQISGHIILVSNETGLGVIPADPMSRRFVDISGRLHQDLAKISDTVIYTVAGIPQFLKGSV